jgi:hypothetical protein
MKMQTNPPKTSSLSLLPPVTKRTNYYQNLYGMPLLNPVQDIIETPELELLIAPIVIQICEETGWNYGEIWIPSDNLTGEETVLEISSIVHIAPDADDLLSLEQFQLCSEGCVVSPGEGLPGRVWSSGEAEWIADATAKSESYWSRNQLAKAFDISNGFATPMIVRDRSKSAKCGRVQAVLVFFNRSMTINH